MLSKKIGLDHILRNIKNSRVSMRVDFNVPLQNNSIKDTTRIVETLPSIRKIIDHKPKGLVLMSHLGRPNGSSKPQFSMKPIVPVLEDLLKRKVKFVDNCYGFNALDASLMMRNQEIVLLENLRFHSEEEGSYKDESGKKVKASKESISKFRGHLNELCDIYVNDAFGTCHRAHSSIVGITCPIRAAGDLLKKELDYFSKALETPKKPFLVILGGAKVADKIPLINNLLDKVDEMIIGGGMAFTFLQAQGINIGNSLVDQDALAIVRDIQIKAVQKNVKIHLPIDFLGATSLQEKENVEVFSLEKGIKDGFMGLDAGKETIKLNDSVINRAQTIVWNGPQGAFENPLFAKGSKEIVKSLINATNKGAISIAGGGDTLNLLKQIEGSKGKLSHVSTGGGASLELLEGKILPGVDHLTSIDDLN